MVCSMFQKFLEKYIEQNSKESTTETPTIQLPPAQHPTAKVI